MSVRGKVASNCSPFRPQKTAARDPLVSSRSSLAKPARIHAVHDACSGFGSNILSNIGAKRKATGRCARLKTPRPCGYVTTVLPHRRHPAAATRPESVDSTTDKDFDALRVRLVALIKSVFPDWTDFKVASLGN